MKTVRRVLYHASDGGRIPGLALVAWTFGGAAIAIAVFAVILALGPGR